jgi:hypothetical protein
LRVETHYYPSNTHETDSKRRGRFGRVAGGFSSAATWLGDCAAIGGVRGKFGGRKDPAS